MKVDCPYPTVRFIAWEARDPAKVFVADPNIRGRYVYTDRCVALVPCPLCKAIPCEPCHRKGKYHAGTHHARRSAALRVGERGVACDDVIKPRIRLKVNAC